ncbi:class I poly(R)-hydroxyalkanoic acid synthase [Pseudooceanicola sediminis]|uniref:Class I poly(R)-hydroxyalkanoic acid synthase n=1 Tax=Pseudooceanicola sediminis TaxID=2211117 RepID=A0A399J2F8_9RHOB|nr:class I poly(R)-hydroxyalkanoic acid synthase [Pseudooceanicola sediminis]KAA2313830.1 class I poly(R)-hydroxyalkanoic acid synthase [Puniceibacterium sp. HSS470]RII38649.1 class I poly(R)-hydroxyalkanoic acid synthase [Pseudooceanicola sediminis]|tara:strand:+ start:5661 stop:7469 length:1809 start_codon:yes stop_codon:yes gene_type:complete
MTTQETVGDVTTSGENLEKLNENLARVDALTQRFLAALQQKQGSRPELNGPDPSLFAKAAGAYWSEMLQNPARIFEHQLEYWGNSVKHFLEAQQAFAAGKLQAPSDSGPDDPRFRNPLWKTHPYFNYIKQQYQLNASAVAKAVEDAEDMSTVEKARLAYFARQIVDLMAPTNFLATNPDALERAIETDGESLVKGLENLVADLEHNNGEMLVRLADDSAFKLGENVATAAGEVVYRNRMIELIQYAPGTEKVHATPLIIFPPWINKFYILDLKEKNSLIRWITDQGFTLFVVSWVNPDATYREVGLEDYIEDGYLAAIEQVKQITGQKQVNTVGYCIGGTTLNLVLALLKKRKDRSVKSATFFTTLTDFSDQGDFTPFLQDDFIDGIEADVREVGILRSHIMSRTFSFLRSNDLVYQPAIRSYMLGEAPPAFDLLYWNGDGTNLPARMAVQYLRRLCQGNEFTTDGMDLLGEHLHISDVTVPICAITCETDHIAAWRSAYRGFMQTKSKDRTFIVSQSGHIAGIVNPPSKKKYGHYTNAALPETAQEWMDGATFTDGSWWPKWGEWLAGKSGSMVPARTPGDSSHPPLCPAPGTYVAAPLPK